MFVVNGYCSTAFIVSCRSIERIVHGLTYSESTIDSLGIHKLLYTLRGEQASFLLHIEAAGKKSQLIIW